MTDPALPAYRRMPVVHPVPVADEEVRARFSELLGLLDVPGPGSVPAELGESETGADGVTVTPLRFRNELDEVVPCILMRSAGTGDELGGIVCMPGTGGTAELISGERLYRPLRHQGPLHGWARELARRGFATLAVTIRGTTARQPNPLERERESKAMEPFGRTAVGLRVREALQAARALAAVDGVSTGRIGLTGFSLGGQAAWLAQAGRSLDPGLGIAGGRRRQHGRGHPGGRPGPPLQPVVHPAPAAALRPGPHRAGVHLSAAAHGAGADRGRGHAGERGRRDGARGAAAYALACCPHRFEVHRPHLNHLFLPEHLDSVAAFFGRWLS